MNWDKVFGRSLIVSLLLFGALSLSAFFVKRWFFLSIYPDESGVMISLWAFFLGLSLLVNGLTVKKEVRRALQEGGKEK